MSSIPNQTKITNEACGINIGSQFWEEFFDTQKFTSTQTKSIPIWEFPVTVNILCAGSRVPG